MKFVCKTMDELTGKQVYEMIKARLAVFCVEQDCVYQDCDDYDYGLHLFYEEDDGTVVAYARLYDVDPKTLNEFPLQDGSGMVKYQLHPDAKTVQIGRMLTINRKTGQGASLLKEVIKAAREIMKADYIYAEAESDVIGFYTRENFVLCSDAYIKDGILHNSMELKL
ncbi:MAG: GNAT family N-acetyltransferase [Clostridia bacterium]|nr:GNAT family N-acetyltransferase [Clostridia bacterium]